MAKQKVRIPGEDPQPESTDEATEAAAAEQAEPTTEQVDAGGEAPPVIIVRQAPPPKPKAAGPIEIEVDHTGRPTPESAAKLSAEQLQDLLAKLPPERQGYMLSRDGWACGPAWHKIGRRSAE